MKIKLKMVPTGITANCSIATLAGDGIENGEN